jgi:hypothetical protein
MRYSFPNLTQPKKSAKIIATTAGLRLASAQKAIAKILGYSDWHDLEQNHSKAAPFATDQIIPHSEYIERQTNLALALASELQIPDGDAQYYLSFARLTGSISTSLADQLEIRRGCWRRTVLPSAKKRKPGSIGRLNVPGRKDETVILRSFEWPTTVITHGGVTTIADFEYVSPRKPSALFVPIRLYLPYGVWKEKDGSEVLFSRDYKPLWRIRKGKRPERVEPWIWIKFVDQHWFWKDTNAPWRSSETKVQMENLLNSHQIAMLPVLADALPLLVNTRLDRFAPAANALKVAREDRAQAA